MSDFTAPELTLLSQLLAHFEVDILRSMKNQEVTEQGRQQYADDLNVARTCRAKLDVLRLVS